MRRQFPQQQKAWLKDVFESLDDAAREALWQAGEEVAVPAGENLPAIKSAAIRVESGLVKLAIASDNRSLTVALFGPGDTLCAPLFHTWENDLFYLKAEEASEIRILPQASVFEAAAAHPEVAKAMMEQLSWASWSLMNTIHMLAFYNLPQRVAQVLLNLTAMFGMPDEKGGYRIGLRFTQEELAELAGARRETLSTVLQDFREDDVLDLRYARIDIRDLAALKQIAGTEPLPFLDGRLDESQAVSRR